MRVYTGRKATKIRRHPQLVKGFDQSQTSQTIALPHFDKVVDE